MKDVWIYIDVFNANLNKDFTDTIPAGVGHFTKANTIELKHCDVIFTVFKKDVKSRIYFENLFIWFQFNVDCKMYPLEVINTFHDEIFINQTFDTLNINNSLLISIGEYLMSCLLFLI